jgi:hypothetical protein
MEAEVGRGLSELQVWMLKRAAERPDRNEFGNGCDLSIARTLHEYYGLSMSARASYRVSMRGYLEAGRAFTDVADEARKHRPAVVRAIRRLEARGLVHCDRGWFALDGYRRWAGMNLVSQESKAKTAKKGKSKKSK